VATSTPSTTFHTLRVERVDELCDDAVAVTFAVPPHLRREFVFAPGQSLTMRRVVDGVDHRRTYSICAPAGAPLRVGVRRVTGGLFSSWLVDAVKIGDEVEMQRPAGRFVADPIVAGRHVGIAAGSGITPVLSIAASVLANPATTMTLLYGNRRTQSVMFAEEIADLKDRYGPRLDVMHVLSREPRDAELFTGRLDAERLRRILGSLVPTAAVDHFWLCGPHGMVVDARRVLGELAVDPQRIHHELFFVEDTPPPRPRHHERRRPGPTSRVVVILDGRTSTFDLPRDEPVLDTAMRRRADLPFSCKGGVCGTCRARVSSGTVDLRRNFALEADELAAGFVLTCQAFPISADVTIDFDS